jgi:pimeloyl-ACP methyl ester carboxylesterase
MDRGAGSPLVLIPGIQGRWEWMVPTIDALASRHRVLSFSLNDSTGRSAFADWMATIDRLVDQTGGTPAAVVGVSFGALAAARYASLRPDRVAALILVSPPAPGWRLDAQSERYARRPRAALPLFAVRSICRLTPELMASFPTWRARTRFAATYLFRVMRWPASPRRMAAWAFEWMQTDIESDCRRIAVPTLVITGEPRLDRVVAVANSLEYLSLISGARHATFEGTGHVGLIAKPREFANMVDRFLGMPAPDERDSDQSAASRPVGAEPLGCG